MAGYGEFTVSGLLLLGGFAFIGVPPPTRSKPTAVVGVRVLAIAAKQSPATSIKPA